MQQPDDFAKFFALTATGMNDRVSGLIGQLQDDRQVSAVSSNTWRKTVRAKAPAGPRSL